MMPFKAHTFTKAFQRIDFMTKIREAKTMISATKNLTTLEKPLTDNWTWEAISLFILKTSFISSTISSLVGRSNSMALTFCLKSARRAFVLMSP